MICLTVRENLYSVTSGERGATVTGMQARTRNWIVETSHCNKFITMLNREAKTMQVSHNDGKVQCISAASAGTASI